MKKIIPYVIAAAIGFAAGAAAFYDTEYGIKRVSGEAYLCLRETEKCEAITDDFQLGSLEYRLDGIREELAEK